MSNQSEMLTQAKKLGEQLADAQVTLQKLNSLVKQSGDHNLQHLCLTQLGDKLLGLQSASVVNDKVIAELES